ncbi:hypothetical protein [Roseateles sp. L2-2]|uniref:hypothetical protein n=1 Tax=Roseateles sp. L2-2 TaxID=3422597 RepID=UPI003D368AA8
MSGYFDPITGVVGLEDRQIMDLLGGRSLEDLEHSDALLRTFLHEATHHASVIGDIGAAYAALLASTDISSETSLIRPRQSTPMALDMHTRDWLLFQLCQAYYVPMLEGLAVYAEYDLFSCAVDVDSGPLLHAKSIYLGKKFKAAVSAALKRMRHVADPSESETLLAEMTKVREDHFNQYLREQRLTGTAVMFKRQLLATPLDRTNPLSCYLLGYLAIKGLYARRLPPSPLRMSTLFHLGVQATIFRDLDVAIRLVSTHDMDINDVQVTCGEVISRIQDRLDLFMTNGREVLLRIQATTTGESKEIDEQLLSSCLFRMGREVHPLASNHFGYRHIFRHAATPVLLEHSGSDVCVRAIDGNLLGHCPTVPNSDHAPQGTVEIASTPSGSELALLILTADGLVAARCMRTGAWNVPEQVALFDEMPSSVLAHQRLQHRVPGALPVNAPKGEVAEVLADTAEQLRTLGEQVLLNLAFPVPIEIRARAKEILREAGFGGIFPGGEIEELAKYSLIFSGEGLSIEEGARLEGRSPEACVARIDEFNARAMEAIGVPLFQMTDPQFATSLI